MKKVIASIAVIAAFASIAYLGTSALFTDTETSENNVFATGSIDIAVDGQNPWEMDGQYTIADMKPGYTDYMEFVIHNVGSNPANVWKKLTGFEGSDLYTTEPECEAEDGDWNAWSTTENTNQWGYIVKGDCSWEEDGIGQRADLESVLEYDLRVAVYDVDPEDNPEATPYWHQTIYKENSGTSLETVYGEDGEVFLGMIPEGWYMKVVQSYHMMTEAGDLDMNVYQGDQMTMDVELYAEQLTDTKILENKDSSVEPWAIVHDDIKATLTYKVKNPTFDFTFSGKAPLPNHPYVLAAGYDAGTNVDTYLGEGTTNSSGDITINGSIELDKNLEDAKVWLVPAENWTTGSGITGWNYFAHGFLWETGLIDYVDTDL